MAGKFALGGLLGHVYTLQDGQPIRLRLARSSDVAAVRELLRRARGGAADPEGAAADLEARRLVHFDPRSRYVLCATGLVDSCETLLGVGAIELDGSGQGPELLVLGDGVSEEIRGLLRSALVASARAHSRAA